MSSDLRVGLSVFFQRMGQGTLDPLEVVIIGIVSDSSNTYIYVDPSDGKYKTIPYWDISKNSKAYAIKDKNNP